MANTLLWMNLYIAKWKMWLSLIHIFLLSSFQRLSFLLCFILQCLKVIF